MTNLNDEDLNSHSLENETKENMVSIELINDNTKDKIEVGLQIESQPKEVDLTDDVHAESKEDKEGTDFSSDDSLADPNYRVENNDLSSDSDERVEDNVKENISLESNQNLTRKRKAQPHLWKTNVAKRLRNAGKEYVGKSNVLVRERRLGPPCTEKCKLKCNTKFDDDTRRQIFNAYYK